MHITGGCCQWRGSGSFDSDVHIETFVIRGKFSGKIATEQQPPIRYASFYNDSPATIKLTDLRASLKTLQFISIKEIKFNKVINNRMLITYCCWYL